MMEGILNLLRKIPVMLEESKVIMFLIDGLGTLNLRVPKARKVVTETVFPTSTPTFLYTFHSLLHPREHGFLEWFMRFKDSIVAIPPWEDVIEGKELVLGEDVSRDDVFPFKSLSEILSEKGFSILYYTPFPESAFTKAVSEGAEVRGIKYLSQVFPLGEADFIGIYWPSVDSIRHERYFDESLKVELGFIELFISYLMKRLPRRTKLYVLSDHGLTLCKQRYLLPTINSTPPVGGERVAFYKGVSVDEVKDVISKEGIPADVYRLNELKYFRGEVSPRCYENYGDVVVIAKENTCFKYPFEKGREKGLGVHGGLSPDERIVNLWEYGRT